MEFSASDPVVRLCLQGLGLAEKGLLKEASQPFQQAWNAATEDLQRFLSAYFLARYGQGSAEPLRWYQTALELALRMDDPAVHSAFPVLYAGIAQCYEALGDPERAKQSRALEASSGGGPTDPGPFYHGTRADLKVGDLLTAGQGSNYRQGLTMNHVYFTALLGGAGLAAALAKGGPRERVYIVEATGGFEDDPNVTNKKFPGNPTRSYRSEAPLKIVGEALDWPKPAPAELEKWRQRVAVNEGEIIN